MEKIRDVSGGLVVKNLLLCNADMQITPPLWQKVKMK